MKRKKPITFIVEGTDCAGKSYLIESLSKEHPAIIIKNTVRPMSGMPDQIQEYRRQIYAILGFISTHHKEKSFILDRSFMSELAYSFKRNYDAFNDPTYKHLEKLLASLPHLYIYCNPGHDIILERLRSRGDDFMVEEDIERLIERYNRFFRETKLNKLELDTSKSIKTLLKRINEKIQ